MEADVVTSADLVLSLNDAEGINGAVAELFDVNEQFEKLRKWKEVQSRSATQGGLSNLSQYSIVQYDGLTVGVMEARVYAYSYSRPAHWKFEMYRSYRNR